MFCKNCGSEIQNENSDFCPSCGNRLRGKTKTVKFAAKNSEKTVMVLLVTLLAIVITVGIYYAFDKNYGKKNIAHTAIDTASGEHFIAVRLNEQWGFIDTQDNTIIPFQYQQAYHFREGLAAVQTKDGKWGYIDTKGNQIIPPQYEDANSFSEGLAAVRIGGKTGYIDKKGNQVVSPKYGRAHRFSNGLAEVWTSFSGDLSTKFGFIDTRGQEVIPLGKYSTIEGFSEGLARVSIKNYQNYYQEIYIDTQDNQVIIPPYGYNVLLGIGNPSYFKEGLTAIYVGSYLSSMKMGFMDKRGRIVIPVQYDEVKSFNEGLAAVKIGDSWGFIDKSGNQVIYCIFDEVGNFSSGLASVKVAWKYGFIDKTGKMVIPPQWEIDNIYPFSETTGLAAVVINNKIGFIDKAGSMVIPAKYDDMAIYWETGITSDVSHFN
jgi:hypothetical protein